MKYIAFIISHNILEDGVSFNPFLLRGVHVLGMVLTLEVGTTIMDIVLRAGEGGSVGRTGGLITILGPMTIC